MILITRTYHVACTKCAAYMTDKSRVKAALWAADHECLVEMPEYVYCGKTPNGQLVYCVGDEA